jgi:hypothetical protein
MLLSINIRIFSDLLKDASKEMAFCHFADFGVALEFISGTITDSDKYSKYYKNIS